MTYAHNRLDEDSCVMVRCRGNACRRMVPAEHPQDGLCPSCDEDQCACPQCGVVIFRDDLCDVAGEPCCGGCVADLRRELDQAEEDAARNAGPMAINEIEGWR